ncbi:MAG: ester cyclase [Desulfobacterales bacterium]|nr:ester cyclase [Desulfobacterales bacterium]
MKDIKKKKLIKQLHHIWNSGEMELIAEVYSPDFIVHWPRGFKVNESHGFDGVRNTIKNIHLAIPDWHEEVKDIIIGDDKVVTRYTSTGTHLGTYAGIEGTGKKISLDEISIYRIEKGRVVEQWCLSDDVSTLLTLGLLEEAPNF